MSWIEHGSQGVAWSGACEEFLGGAHDRAEVGKVIDTVVEPPDELAEWDGSFSVAVWDERLRRVIIVTVATQNQTICWGDEPDGLRISRPSNSAREFTVRRKPP